MAEYFLGQIKGGSVTVVEIFNEGASAVGDYTLLDDITNYDIIAFEFSYGLYAQIEYALPTTLQLENTHRPLMYGYGNSTAYSHAKVKNKSLSVTDYNGVKLEKIYGIIF